MCGEASSPYKYDNGRAHQPHRLSNDHKILKICCERVYLRSVSVITGEVCSTFWTSLRVYLHLLRGDVFEKAVLEESEFLRQIKEPIQPNMIKEDVSAEMDGVYMSSDITQDKGSRYQTCWLHTSSMKNANNQKWLNNETT